MTVNKSIIEDAELDNGYTFYIQFSGSRSSASVSFDGPDSSFNITLTNEDIEKITKAITKAVGENNGN